MAAKKQTRLGSITKRIREKGSQTDDDLEELPDHEGDATLKALDDIRNKLESLLLLKPAVDDLKSVIAKLTEENKQLMHLSMLSRRGGGRV